MKKIITKAEIRAAMEREISHFKKTGGVVNEIPRGLSGRDPMDNSMPNTQRLFLEPTEKRTLVPEVVAAIESRRKQKPPSKSPIKPARTRRRMKMIYDDFGEPLRQIWVEE